LGEHHLGPEQSDEHCQEQNGPRGRSDWYRPTEDVIVNNLPAIFLFELVIIIKDVHKGRVELETVGSVGLATRGSDGSSDGCFGGTLALATISRWCTIQAACFGHQW
jgi:hypothetical protein